MTGNIKIRQYMRQELEDHRDPKTDEINTTSLAEDAADKFDLYDESGDPQERLFELAFEIAEADERRRTGRIGSALGNFINVNDDYLRG